MALADQDTVDFESTTQSGDEPLAVGLSLLSHPDASRVGEVSVLFSRVAGGSRQVNRLEPQFNRLGDRAGQPLANAALSRNPITIRTTETGVIELSPTEGCRARFDGTPLTQPVQVSANALSRGVVLELGECVLLLLHWVSPKRDSTSNLGLVGDSIAIRSLRSEIEKLADSETCVLIRGESGSGKELVARAIHRLSRRRSQPYVAVNLGAIPGAMAASALFGHARGAFTGAVSSHPGFFGSAENGTLFLDEIGEAPRQVQAMLLRAVRENEIQPVGEATPRGSDVRLIAATDADLEALCERGEFTAALLRRIEAYTLEVPALRARRDDIARLFYRFLRAELEQVGELCKLDEPPPGKKPWLPCSFVARLLEYSFPGNVAELETVARRVAIGNRGAKHFTVDSWLAQRFALDDTLGSNDSDQTTAAPGKTDPRDLTDEQIVKAMREARFKVVRATEILGVSRSWLNTRLEFCSGLRKAKELDEDEIRHAAAQADGRTSRMAEVLEVSEHGLKLRMKTLGLTALASR